MDGLRHWQFWVAVILVVLAVNFVWNYLTKKGKLL